MNFRESAEVGLTGLLTHKLRSLLTALGIIFGVAAVIAMLSIGEGARREALEQIRLMGVNNVIIRAKDPTQQSFSKAKANFSPGLTMLDGEAIREICPMIESIVPQWEKTVAAQYRSERKDIKIIATTPEFLPVFNYALNEGVFLAGSNLERQDNVCVIGNGVKDKLFHFEDPLGKQIKLDNQWFLVVGVMEKQLSQTKKIENLQLRNLNMDVYLPLTTAQYKMERLKGSTGGSAVFFGGGARFTSGSSTRVPRQQLDQLVVKVAGERALDEVIPVINHILARRHYGIDDYEVIVPDALVDQSQKTQRIFNVVMGAIAGISLLVGGIGIMNIMLASVLERTREIGVRRAMGARRSDVLAQFLTEAIVLSVAGGLAGIVVGYALTEIITLYAEWRTIISLPAVALAFIVSVGVGIAFGYYPARKAAFQNPIESLRYE
ncbi:MAG TPA: ABC transporter permease [Bacteroidota bacterium]